MITFSRRVHAARQRVRRGGPGGGGGGERSDEVGDEGRLGGGRERGGGRLRGGGGGGRCEQEVGEGGEVRRCCAEGLLVGRNKRPGLMYYFKKVSKYSNLILISDPDTN